MINTLFLLLAVFSNLEKSQVYEYVNYSIHGESYIISFDKENNRIASGSNYSSVVYRDCSTINFKCLKIDEDTFYIPRELDISGEFKSPYGNYVVYNNKGTLPFDSSIEYKIVKLIRDTKNDSITLFYNKNKGVIAMLDSSINNDEFSKIHWLVSNCGLLASNECENLTKGG